MIIRYSILKNSNDDISTYALYDREYKLIVSKWLDFDTVVYVLLFKLRSYGKLFKEHIQHIKSNQFQLVSDFEVIPLAEKDEDNGCKVECMPIPNKESKIDLDHLDENDEYGTMKYLSFLNNNRVWEKCFMSTDYLLRKLVDIEKRDALVNDVNKRMLQLIESVKEGDDRDALLRETISKEEIVELIKGENGDVWVDTFMFLMEDEEDDLKYRLLYENQGLEICLQDKHQSNVDYVLKALDNTKANPDNFWHVYHSLPYSMRELEEVKEFYNWNKQEYC